MYAFYIFAPFTIKNLIQNVFLIIHVDIKPDISANTRLAHIFTSNGIKFRDHKSQ